MGRIITISREFGSGGREVGKRLADTLNFAYYDKEIIAMVAEKSGFAPDYIEKYSEAAASRQYPIHIAGTFMTPIQMPSEKLQITQSKILNELSETGNCVIIGRRADYILEAANPFKVFIYSSNMDDRIARCFAKDPSDMEKSKKEMEKKILTVDKQRGRYYNYYTSQTWGKMSHYNLCIDTSAVSIKKAVELIASAIKESV